MKITQFKTNFSWMFIGNLAFTASQWVVLTTIAKFDDIKVVGDYTFALAILSPIFLFSYFQLRSIVITNEDVLPSNAFFLRLCFLLLASIISFIIGYFITTTSFIFYILICIKLIEGAVDLIHGYIQSKEEMKYISKSLIFRSIAFSGIVGLFYLNSYSIEYSLIVYTIISLLILIFYDFSNIRKIIGNFNLKYDKTEVIKLIRLSFPLAIVTLIISLNSNVSKYFVEGVLGTEKQGVYSLIGYVVVLGSFIVRSMGQVLLPRLNKYYSQNNILEFSRISNIFIFSTFFLGIIFTIFSYFFGEIFLEILFSSKISEYKNLLVLYGIASIFLFSSSSLGYTMTSLRMYKPQPIIESFILVLNLISLSILVPLFGLYGAVYSLIFVYSVKVIIMKIVINKVI